jgi:hypothetical protein
VGRRGLTAWLPSPSRRRSRRWRAR